MDPSTALALALAALAAYVASESTFLHVSRTARRAFLAGVGGAVGWAAAGALPQLDAWWLVASAVIAASYFEDEVQKRAVLTRFSVPEAAAVRGSPEAEGVAAALDAAAAAVSAHRGVTLSLSQVAGRASGSLARERGRMVATLRALSRADLNAVLPNVCLAAVLEAGGPLVADVLASRAPSGRLDELGVLARAALVDALQKLGLRGRAQRQAWAAAAILATRGIDLTRVKALLDDGGDHHSFFRLVHSDLQGGARAAVLAHVAAEGAAVATAFARAHAAGPPGVLLKVVSDIDDTLVCSGGAAPAGVDARLPKGCPYPGAAAFLSELDAGHAARLAAALEAPPVGGGAGGGRPSGDGGAPGTPSASDADARAARGAARRLASTLLAPWDADFNEAARHRLAQAAAGGATAAPPSARRGAPPPLHQRGGHLVFLSARPETYRGLTEAASYRHIFAPLLATARLHRWPVLLLGTLRVGPRALAARLTRAAGPRPRDGGSAADLTTHLHVSIYRRKLERLTKLIALYPEACWIVVGDNGQGDVLLAEELARRAMAPPRRGAPPPLPLVAAFIMRAGPVTKTLSALRCSKSNKAAWLAAWRGERVFVHKTYVGCAVDAATLGLIPLDGLQRVALEACFDVRAARARYGPTAVDWGRVARRVNADVAAANAVLPDELRVAPLRLEEEGGGTGAKAGATATVAPASPRGSSPPPRPARSRGSSAEPPPSRWAGGAGPAPPPHLPPPRRGRPGSAGGGLLSPLAEPTARGLSPPWSPLAGTSPLGTSPAAGGAWPPAWAGRRSASPGASRGASPERPPPPPPPPPPPALGRRRSGSPEGGSPDPPPRRRMEGFATSPTLASGLGEAAGTEEEGEAGA